MEWNISEVLDKQVRGEDTAPNKDNKVSKRRRKIHQRIVEQSEKDPVTAYSMAIDNLEMNKTRLQEYVLVHGETPMEDIEQLVVQVYELRMKDAQDLGQMLDYDLNEAITYMESEEAKFYDDNGYEADHFLGDLWASVVIAYAAITKGSDGFIDFGALLGKVSDKLNRDALVRAAQGKKAGISGNLSAGGKRKFEGLKKYFAANPKIAEKVINGEITDESQLPDWGAPKSKGGGSDPIKDYASDVLGDQLKKAIPYIIGFVVLIAVVVYFSSRAKK